MTSTGNDGINPLGRWNCWDSFFRAQIFLSRKISAIENFRAGFFWAQKFFYRKFLRVKIFVAGNFPDPDFSPDPEIAISPRNLKIVPFWDFRFLHFLRSKFSTSENF